MPSRKAMPMCPRHDLPRLMAVVVALWFTLTGFAWAEAAAPVTKQPKVTAVLPFVPLDAGIKRGAGETLRDLLAAELNRQSPGADQAGAIEAEAVSLPTESDSATAVAEVQSAIAAARRELVDGARDKALRTLSGASPSVELALPNIESGTLAELHSLRAFLLFQRGRDAEASIELRQAILFSPDAPLVEERASRRLAREARLLREALSQSAHSSLMVESVPAGARVEVDGRLLGVTPLVARGLPEGRHLVRVFLPTSALPLARLIEVQGNARFEARLKGTDPLRALLDGLADNRLTPEALAAARAWASSRNAAEIIVGALSRESEGGRGMVRLSALIIDASSGAVRRLPAARFDADLLSAGIEIAKSVRALFAAGNSHATLVLPLELHPEWRPSARVAEVGFAALSPSSEDAPHREKPARPAVRRPIDPRRAAGALKPRDP